MAMCRIAGGDHYEAFASTLEQAATQVARHLGLRGTWGVFGGNVVGGLTRQGHEYALHQGQLCKGKRLAHQVVWSNQPN